MVSFVLFCGWYFFYTDDPRKNRFVTDYELSLIHYGKSEAHKNKESFVPYLVIFKVYIKIKKRNKNCLENFKK